MFPIKQGQSRVRVESVRPGTTYVTIPEVIKMPTRVQVPIIPSADEKERYRNGRKLVGIILCRTQSVVRGLRNLNLTYTISPTTFHWSLVNTGQTASTESANNTTIATLMYQYISFESITWLSRSEAENRSLPCTHFQ
jgi:hypothetical protein